MVKKSIVLVFGLLCTSIWAQPPSDTTKELVFHGVHPPRFQGDLRVFIQKTIIYPESACRDLIEGRVNVEYWVDTTGVTIKHKIGSVN